jgi:hypothetical protein
MSRFMKLACVLAVTAGFAAIPANAESQADNAVARPDAPSVRLSTTTNWWGCCYIYFNGRWICIPCG